MMREGSDTLLLIDGHNLLFQMFFGMPARVVGRNGKAIHGTLGFVGALLKIIRMTGPTHVAVLFDGEHPNNRAELDSGYKSNRPDYSTVPEEESPFSQLPDIYSALDCLRIAHTEIPDGETDDAIASYVYSANNNTRIVISSFDSDFFQLISDSVSVLRYRGDRTELCTPETVQRKCGVPPEQYADWKCLVGDTADHIPGVPGIGSKTAASLLARYGTLAQLLANPETITPQRIRNSILQHTERLQINRRLIRLENRTSLPFSMEQMRFADTGMTTIQVLQKTGLRE